MIFAWSYVVIFVGITFVERSIQQRGIEYIDGYRSSCKFHQQEDVNLIISAPHGGSLTPRDVPDRTEGGCIREIGPDAGICTWFYDDPCEDGEPCESTTVTDYLSDEFAENVANELSETWSLTPTVIIGKWSRKKVDFNREINEATFNYPEAILAYQSYHSNIEQAVDRIYKNFGKGLLIDIHGQSAGE
jgi:hypothetical protein